MIRGLLENVNSLYVSKQEAFLFFHIAFHMLGETPLSCPLTFWVLESFRGLCCMVLKPCLFPGATRFLAPFVLSFGTGPCSGQLNAFHDP